VSSPSIIDPWNSLTYIKYSLATSISHGGGITFQYNRKLQNEIISKEEPARFQSLMTGGFLKRVTNFKAPFSSHIHLYNPEKGVNEDKALVTAPLSLFNTAHFVQHRHHVAAGIPFLTGKVSAGDGSHGCFLGIKTEPTPSTNDYGAVTFGLETSAFGKTGPDGHTHNVFATSASNNLFLTAGKIDKVVAQIFEDNKQLKEKRGSLRVDLTHSKDAKWILATDDDMRLKRHAVGMLLGMDDAVSEEQYQQIFSSYRDFFNDKVFKYHGAPRNWQDFNKLCESAQAQITKAKDEQGSIDETKPRSLSDSSSGSTSSEGSNEEKESKNSVASSDSETARSISQNSPSTATPTVPHQRENLVPHETFKISSYGELLHLTLQSELELTIYEQLGGGEDHRNEQELYQRLVREMPRKLVQKEDANFESCYAKILKISDTKIRMYLLQDLIRICAKTKEVKHSQQDEIKNPLGELLRLANNSQWDTQGKKCGISFFPSKTPTAILDIRKFNPGKDTYENLISKIHSQMQSKWSTFGRSEQTKAYYELIMSAYFVLRRSHIDKAAIASAIEEITRNFSKQFQLDSSTSVSAPSSTLPLA
jgi:hypothetical protein